jgi:hypothetical protein
METEVKQRPLVQLIPNPNPLEDKLVPADLLYTKDLGAVLQKRYKLHTPTWRGITNNINDPLYYIEEVIHIVKKFA